MKIKSLTLHIAISIVTVFFLFFLIEMFYRWKISAFPFRYEMGRNTGFVLDPQLGYRIKNMKGFNSLGLKNPEILPKAEQVRILLLGDSVVYCFNTALLKKRLTAYYPSLEIEIINTGMPGYTTKQELDFLRLYGLGMEPDLVILGFVLNDLYIYLHRPTPNGSLFGLHPYARRTFFGRDSAFGRIFYRSYLAHFIVRGVDMFYKKMIRPPMYSFERRGDFHAAWKDFMWKDEAIRLKEMQDLLRSKGIPFAIVCFPVTDQFNEGYINRDREYLLKPQRKLSEICRTYQIPLLDLWNYFYNRGDNDLIVDYHHLSPTANILFADKLAEFINKQRMVSYNK